MSQCKDCPPGTSRPAPFAGPRCATHDRAVRKARKAAAHDSRVCKVYGLAPGQYAEILAAQDGRCYICRWATGASKRLAVDHCHETGRVRGILCGPCNQMIGRLGSDALRRAANYLDTR